MDTQNSAVAEIPNLKLAKVGDKRKRKGAGGWLSGGGRGAGSFAGATGGAGGGGAFASLFTLKGIIMLAVASSIGMAAWRSGGGGTVPSTKPPQQQKLFAGKDEANKYADTSGVIKQDNSIPNSLGYISGSTDGLTPEERAKKQAEDEAARKAADEAAKKQADEDAKKAAAEPKEPAPSGPAADPNALAEAAAPKKALTAGKLSGFGSLGGANGLSGGAGLSGGINRNFGASTLPMKDKPGSMAAFRGSSKPGMTTSPRAAAGNSKAKGFARRQLDNAFAQSRQAMTAGKSETAATTAAAPFDNNSGLGGVITGPGVGNSGQGSNGDAGTSINPTNTGGPLGASNVAACTQNGYEPDINGNCVPINQPPPKNDDPNQWIFDTVNALLIAIAVLSAIAWVLDKIKTPWTQTAAFIMKYIVASLGALVACFGILLMARHQLLTGGILTAVGGYIAISIWTEKSATFDKGGESKLAELAANQLIASAVGMLASSAQSAQKLQ